MSLCAYLHKILTYVKIKHSSKEKKVGQSTHSPLSRVQVCFSKEALMTSVYLREALNV